MGILVNMLISVCVIGLATWLSGRFPAAAGFLVAMPITTLLVLPLSQMQHEDTENTVLMAQSIFVAIPVSLAFFVPFLLAARYELSFWQAYGWGCGLLVLGYFAHRLVVRSFFTAT